MIDPQLKRGLLDICVLSVLRREDSYGYQLIKDLSGCIEISESTLYPILRRLTSEDYFKTYLTESSSGPARKYYSIIPAGREFLETLKKDWFEFAGIVEILLRGEAL